jgi:hypothetical protein
MSELLRRFRGTAVALVVLAISAGAVFAGSPHARPTTEAPVAQAEEEATETPEVEEAESPDADETAPPDAEEAAEATDNHGALVSEAAGMETPEGFANHGAFVSCVAHMKDGSLGTVVWADVTPESCAAAAEAAKAAKAAAKAEREVEREAAKALRAEGKAKHGKAVGKGKPAGS